MGKYFTIAEMTKSSTAISKGIDNTPDAQQTAKINALIDNVLDKVRVKWRKPIKVNSGFRSQKLNTAVGGVPTSQHTLGEAADITAGSPSENAKLYALILDMWKNKDIEFDQLIDEKNFTWVHISYRAGNNRGHSLKIQ